jgi:hypothetical protein
VLGTLYSRGSVESMNRWIKVRRYENNTLRAFVDLERREAAA